ncbi:MAG: hypothetical protein K2J90_00410 [Lachnospiraceae bacterium]|nr:hypothetical protein [Lachnospiraceae bacterium]MDE6759121.1 hypothetical protein [Lachnospiraceae bacterium]
MEKNNNLFEWFDRIIESSSQAVEYAEKHFEQLHDREKKAVKNVITSLGYGLGIACPSLIVHRVVGGNKKGVVIKEAPKGKEYNVISYDKKENPIAVRSYDKFGTQDAYYFYKLGEYIWAVKLDDHTGKAALCDIYRILFQNRKIKSYYEICLTPYVDSLWGEEYEYPEDESISVRCRQYSYTKEKVQILKDIPVGLECSPLSEYLYEISGDGKKIAEYEKVGNNYEFCREYV